MEKSQRHSISVVGPYDHIAPNTATSLEAARYSNRGGGYIVPHMYVCMESTDPTLEALLDRVDRTAPTGYLT